MSTQPVLIRGEWKTSSGTESFQAINPQTREQLPGSYPVSPWEEIEEAIDAASAAFRIMRDWSVARVADFLDAFANEIESRTEAIVESAHQETGLPIEPRLKSGELPRTTNQLRQAAGAARDGSWALPTIDRKANIRSIYAPLGPVVVFGPNNFPLAFNGISGGDFAAAVAAGNPVIAKGHPSHPRTTQLLAEAADRAAKSTEMPPGFVQLIYRTSHADGERLVSHPKIAACGYTGSRAAGLALKAAADRAGKPIYLELSSINPVFLLPGAIEERLDTLVEEFTGSCLMGSGQFCTNPGLVVLQAGELAERFIGKVAERFQQAPAGTLLSPGVEKNLQEGLAALVGAGAEVVVGNVPADANRCCFANTLLRTTGEAFLDNPEGFQQEAFGNSSLFVLARDESQLAEVAEQLEGNLTGGIYSDRSGKDDKTYDLVAPILRQKVGRLLNDKMPTGVAVSPAMNHGGPFPATGHPGFTAVGIPASLRRFAMLQCYDAVRPHRLPASLQDKNPTGRLWRLVDGDWTRDDL